MSIPTAHARRRHAPAAHSVADRTPGSAQPGTIYLLHFSEPYKHARHYRGWTAGPLEDRLADHAAGRGTRLLAVVRSAEITWSLARTWPAGRTRERSLKRSGGSSRHCPMCGVTPRSRAHRDTVADHSNRYPAYAAGHALRNPRQQVTTTDQNPPSSGRSEMINLIDPSRSRAAVDALESLAQELRRKLWDLPDDSPQRPGAATAFALVEHHRLTAIARDNTCAPCGTPSIPTECTR